MLSLAMVFVTKSSRSMVEKALKEMNIEWDRTQKMNMKEVQAGINRIVLLEVRTSKLDS